jgi:hypothetical protein
MVLLLLWIVLFDIKDKIIETLLNFVSNGSDSLRDHV